jgi:hypothetical protein
LPLGKDCDSELQLPQQVSCVYHQPWIQPED